MRPILLLIPASFLFLAYVVSVNPYSESIARTQMEADTIAAMLNEASSNLSALVSGDPSFKGEESAKAEIHELQSRMRSSWMKLDRLKVRAAIANRLRVIVRAIGTGLAILAFGMIASTQRKQALACLFSIGILLAISGV